jgi:hypothetical protein
MHVPPGAFGDARADTTIENIAALMHAFKHITLKHTKIARLTAVFLLCSVHIVPAWQSIA